VRNATAQQTIVLPVLNKDLLARLLWLVHVFSLNAKKTPPQDSGNIASKNLMRQDVGGCLRSCGNRHPQSCQIWELGEAVAAQCCKFSITPYGDLIQKRCLTKLWALFQPFLPRTRTRFATKAWKHWAMTFSLCIISHGIEPCRLCFFCISEFI